MKKILATILAATMVLSLAACGGKKGGDEFGKSNFDALVSTITNNQTYSIEGSLKVQGNSGVSMATDKLLSVFGLDVKNYTTETENVEYSIKKAQGGRGYVGITGKDTLEAYYIDDTAYINKEYVLSRTKLDNKNEVAEAIADYVYIEINQKGTKVSDIVNLLGMINKDFGADATYTKEQDSLNNMVYKASASAEAIASMVSNAGFSSDADFTGKTMTYQMEIVRANDNTSSMENSKVTVIASNGDGTATLTLNISKFDSSLEMPNESLVATEDMLVVNEQEEVGNILAEPDYTGNGFEEYTSDIGFKANDWSNIIVSLGRFQDITAVKASFNEYIKPIRQALINEAIFGDTPNTGSSDEKAELVAEVLDTDTYEQYKLACDHIGYQVVSYSLAKEIEGVSLSDDFITHSIERIQKYTGVVINPELIKEMAAKCLQAEASDYLIRVGNEDDRYNVVVSITDKDTEDTNITWTIQGSYRVD